MQKSISQLCSSPSSEPGSPTREELPTTLSSGKLSRLSLRSPGTTSPPRSSSLFGLHTSLRKMRGGGNSRASSLLTSPEPSPKVSPRHAISASASARSPELTLSGSERASTCCDDEDDMSSWHGKAVELRLRGVTVFSRAGFFGAKKVVALAKLVDAACKKLSENGDVAAQYVVRIGHADSGRKQVRLLLLSAQGGTVAVTPAETHHMVSRSYQLHLVLALEEDLAGAVRVVDSVRAYLHADTASLFIPHLNTFIEIGSADTSVENWHSFTYSAALFKFKLNIQVQANVIPRIDPNHAACFCFLAPPLAVALIDFIDSRVEKTIAASSLVQLFSMFGKLDALVREVAFAELTRCSDINILFRAQGLKTRLVMHQVRSASQQFLEKLITEIRSSLYSEVVTFNETDPESKFMRLFSIVARRPVPAALRDFLHYVYNITETRFPGMGATPVTGLLFLRLVVPCFMTSSVAMSSNNMMKEDLKWFGKMLLSCILKNQQEKVSANAVADEADGPTLTQSEQKEFFSKPLKKIFNSLMARYHKESLNLRLWGDRPVKKQQRAAGGKAYVSLSLLQPEEDDPLPPTKNSQGELVLHLRPPSDHMSRPCFYTPPSSSIHPLQSSRLDEFDTNDSMDIPDTVPNDILSLLRMVWDEWDAFKDTLRKLEDVQFTKGNIASDSVSRCADQLHRLLESMFGQEG